MFSKIGFGTAENEPRKVWITDFFADHLVRSGTLFVGLTFTSAHEQDSEPLPKKLPAEAPSGDKDTQCEEAIPGRLSLNRSRGEQALRPNVNRYLDPSPAAHEGALKP